MVDRYLHLEPVGGIAGDMFAAALLDAWPELEPELHAALGAAGLSSLVEVQRYRHNDQFLTGSRLTVRPAEQYYPRHRAFHEIRAFIKDCALAPKVKKQALAIFKLLAQAESRVHGIPVETVTFHEVGAWDSIADIVMAAWLIDAVNVTGWSCAPLPMGRGRVAGAHGLLPVPAPATTLLLEGFPLFQDDYEGERVTPTGAAILRHLQPSVEPLRVPMRLTRSGIGFGSKTFTGLSNILRVLAFETEKGVLAEDQVMLCQFELDDQSPEDLAVALERLRALSGVLDVLQAPVFGKKGRLAVQVQILSRPETRGQVLQQCFTETSTLGVRWQIVQRAVLKRDGTTQEIAGRPVRVKRARRPGETVTAKAEMDDLAGMEGGFAGREQLRRQAQKAALASGRFVSEEKKNDET